MAWNNTAYHGPDIMIKLMRATDIPWQQESMRNGYLISNGQYKSDIKEQHGMLHPFKQLDSNIVRPFSDLSERELRNLHSSSSSKTSNSELQTPNSKYISMTSSVADTSWGQGSNPSIVFRFDIWRSDIWKGKHDIPRNQELLLWLNLNISNKPPEQQKAIISEQTPPDWDKGMEFEWLALGGTKIYNVEETLDKKTWTKSTATNSDIVFWWESIKPKKL